MPTRICEPSLFSGCAPVSQLAAERAWSPPPSPFERPRSWARPVRTSRSFLCGLSGSRIHGSSKSAPSVVGVQSGMCAPFGHEEEGHADRGFAGGGEGAGRAHGVEHREGDRGAEAAEEGAAVEVSAHRIGEERLGIFSHEKHEKHERDEKMKGPANDLYLFWLRASAVFRFRKGSLVTMAVMTEENFSSWPFDLSTTSLMAHWSLKSRPRPRA